LKFFAKSSFWSLLLKCRASLSSIEQNPWRLRCEGTSNLEKRSKRKIAKMLFYSGILDFLPYIDLNEFASGKVLGVFRAAFDQFGTVFLSLLSNAENLVDQAS
jgi:hypothetical protein